MDWEAHIVADPAVQGGKPVLVGTRLTVDFVLDLLAAGWTTDDVAAEYPGVTHEQVLACLAYARDVLRSETVLPLSAS